MKRKSGDQKISDGKVRVPGSLMIELRQEAARYNSKGHIAPSHGEMLAEAWEYRKIAIAKNDYVDPTRSTEAVLGRSVYGEGETEKSLGEIVERLALVHANTDRILALFGGDVDESVVEEDQDQDPIVRELTAPIARTVERLAAQLERHKAAIREAIAGDKVRVLPHRSTDRKSGSKGPRDERQANSH
jgi:hypothetical protein